MAKKPNTYLRAHVSLLLCLSLSFIGAALIGNPDEPLLPLRSPTLAKIAGPVLLFAGLILAIAPARNLRE